MKITRTVLLVIVRERGLRCSLRLLILRLLLIKMWIGVRCHRWSGWLLWGSRWLLRHVVMIVNDIASMQITRDDAVFDIWARRWCGLHVNRLPIMPINKKVLDWG